MELRVASALQAWAADPTAVPPAVLAAIKEHVQQDSRPTLLLELPDVLLAYVLSKLPARSLGVAVRTCRATRRALAAAMQMRAQLLGLTPAGAPTSCTLGLHFAEVAALSDSVASLLPPVPPPAAAKLRWEGRPRLDVFGNYRFGPTNEMDLLNNYTFAFEFYTMDAKFTKRRTGNPFGGGWRVQMTATGASVKLLSLTPTFVLSDDDLSALSELFQQARDDTTQFIHENLVSGNLDSDGGWPDGQRLGPFLCAKLFVHCRRTNQMRVLLDCEWDSLEGERMALVNSAGFTHFKEDVTHYYKDTFMSKDEDGDDIEMNIESEVHLQIAALTDLRLSLVHTYNQRADEPHTPETDQLIYEKNWFPFEKPVLWAALLIDGRETHTTGLRDLARLIDGCFDRPHIYRPLCPPLPRDAE